VAQVAGDIFRAKAGFTCPTCASPRPLVTYLFFLFILPLGLHWSFVIYAMRNVALSVVLAAAAAGATASEESKPTFKVGNLFAFRTSV